MAQGIGVWREIYDEAAAQPDWWRAHRWGYGEEVARATVEDIRRKLAAEPHHRILEVGCGCGMVLNMLLQDGQRGVGIDLSEDLIRRASDFGVDRTRLDLIVGEAARLPLCDGMFDRVLCYSVFQCFPDHAYARRCLRELIRVCKPGGTILVGDVFGSVDGLRAVSASNGYGRGFFRAAMRLPGMGPVRLALAPIRWGLAQLRGRSRVQCETEEDVERLFYTRRFFRRIGARYGCRVEILSQHIAGRESLARLRFDVRMTRSGAQQ